MLGAFETILRSIDDQIDSADTHQATRLLGQLPVDIFGHVLLDVPTWLPNLRAFLPSMPPEDVQIGWTGSAGATLLRQSLTYYRGLRAEIAALNGLDWSQATVADYGCGWGRITRLFLQHTPSENIYALDPWDCSIELCRQHGIKAHLLQCDYVPTDLPVGSTKFDVINCMSIFTHLSERCHRQVLSVLREYVNNDGILVATIRLPEYWDIHEHYPSGLTPEAMRSIHRDQGFAFIPHNREPIDGDVTYGDTSIALD